MARLIDCDMEYFLDYVKMKKVIAFGAGRKFKKFFLDFSLFDSVDFVVDNAPEKQGTNVEIDGKKIPVRGVNELVESYDINTIIVITNLASFTQIMEQLNSFPSLEQAECFCANLMQDRCRKMHVEYTKGLPRIPKIVHYCWFGKNPIPKDFLEYIDGWHRILEDYKIKRWDESNYDIGKNTYMREAYEARAWGFVPDYARLDIVYSYGGIYLDVDVQVVKPFDDLLHDDAFFGFTNYNEIACGLGFGAVQGNLFIKELRDYYDDRHFLYPDGKKNMTSCIDYQQPVFRRHGFRFDNTYQNIHGCAVYPVEVFNPRGVLGISELETEHTHSIHHSARTWETIRNKKDYEEIRGGMAKIPVETRLFSV